MSTLLQKNLAENIVRNAVSSKKMNKKELLVSSGYALKSATSVPSKILEQKGVVEALEDFGFSEENAKKVVSEIMLDPKKDPNARLKATDQVFKVHRSYGEGGQTNNTNIVFMPPELLKKYGLDNTDTSSK